MFLPSWNCFHCPLMSLASIYITFNYLLHFYPAIHKAFYCCFAHNKLLPQETFFPFAIFPLLFLFVCPFSLYWPQAKPRKTHVFQECQITKLWFGSSQNFFFWATDVSQWHYRTTDLCFRIQSVNAAMVHEIYYSSIR